VRDAVPRQPGLLGSDPVRDEREDGHAGHDDRCIYIRVSLVGKVPRSILFVRKRGEKGREIKLTVQRLPTNRKLIRREQHRDHPRVPEDPDELERLAPPPQTPPRLREPFRREHQPAQADEAVRRRRGHARRGDERREGHHGGEDGAGHQGRDGPDDDDGIARLAVLGDARDPVREGEHAVAGDGEDEARGGDDGDGGVLVVLLGLLSSLKMECSMDTYKPQGNYADDIHEYVPAFAQHCGVQRYEWLRRAKGEEGIWFRL